MSNPILGFKWYNEKKEGDMRISRLLLLGLSSILLSQLAGLVWADTQNDISPQEAVSIIKEYETEYMNRDLDKMVKYVDQDSKWFKSGFLEEFKAVFNNFKNINLYHFGKKQVFYIDDGVEITQNTLYVAYSSSLTDINEFTENYYLKKVNGKYKIAECARFPGKDVELVDKGTGVMLENKADEAILHFKKALEHNKDNSVARFRLGMIYSRTGKLTEGLEELKKAIELRPNVGFYRLELFRLYKQLGEKEKATEELTRAITLDPGIEKTLVRKE